MSPHLILVILTFTIAYVYSFPAERYETSYYDSFTGNVTHEQERWQERGVMCRNFQMPTGINYFENVMNYIDPVSVNIKSMISTPVKHPNHHEPSPMTSYFVRDDTMSFQMCAMDQVLISGPNNTKNFGVNWMINTDDVFGSVSAMGTMPPDEEINIAIPMDVDKSKDYTFFAGIIHPSMGQNYSFQHFDTVWIKYLDTEVSGTPLARMAWSDSPDITQNDPVTISVMAVPIDDNPPTKTFETGKVEFIWPEDLAASGTCIDIPFQNTFDFPPTVFATTELNMDASSLAVTTWVESVTETGCQICHTLMHWHGVGRTARMQGESGTMKFHYMAFTQVYTDSQIDEITNPTHYQISASGMTFPEVTDEVMSQAIQDITSLVDFTHPFNMVSYEIISTNKVNFYFDSNGNSGAKEAADKFNSESNFQFDMNSQTHNTFVSKYGNSNSTNQTISFTMDYGMFPVISNIKKTSDCTEDSCSEEGGTVTVSREVVKEGISYKSTTDDNFSYSKEFPCNHEPCSFKSATYYVYENEDSSFRTEIEGGSGGSSTTIIIIVVVIVVIVIAAGAYFYMKKSRKK